MSDLKAMLELLKQASEMKEFVDLAIVEVKPYLEKTIDGVVDLKHRAIERYIKLGYTKEEAIMLSMDSEMQLQKALRKGK